MSESTSFDYAARMFHVGHLVRDIHQAVVDLGASLGLEWTEVVERDDQRIWTPEHGQRTVPLKFAYSTRGPQRLELIEGPPDTLWFAGDHPGNHHSGVWADVPALTSDLVSRGWTLVASQVSPEEGYGSFSYVRSPDGFLLEPVAESNIPRMERWFNGGGLS